MPNISVILPVYNGETYLESSIQSILSQTYSDFELIIVNDCSKDKTESIVEKYLPINSSIKYIKNEVNLKLPASLNKGFSIASGQYLTWTSCDNILLPNAFEMLVNELEVNNNIGLVYASMENIDDQNRFIGIAEAGPPDEIIYRNVVGACFLYRKSIADKVGSYNENLFLCEDYDYWLRMALMSEIKPISKCLYRYRKHKKSLSHNYERKVISRGIAVQKNYCPLFIKSRKQAAIFYAHLRARDIYNPFRHWYLLVVFYYNPIIFFKEVYGLIHRRFK